jgi:hypothetical protein
LRSTSRIPRSLAFAIFFLVPSVAMLAQRLPGVARPQHYTLQLAPDLQAATFTGEETIDLTLAQAVDSLALNAWQLKFGAVTAQVGGKTLPAEVTLDPGLQQVTFHFARKLGPLP